MLAWSVAALAAAEPVGEVVVACPPGHLDVPGLEEAGLEGTSLRVVEGGRERSESVRNAIEGVESELVAIHDAARPLLTPELAEGVIATLVADSEAAGAIAATPVVDTIKQASFGLIESTLDRARLWAAQTPQVFRTSVLREALADAGAVASATDEAMLVEALGGRVLIHPTPAENLKVTTPLDLRLAEMLLSG